MISKETYEVVRDNAEAIVLLIDKPTQESRGLNSYVFPLTKHWQVIIFLAAKRVSTFAPVEDLYNAHELSKYAICYTFTTTYELLG